MLIYASKYNDVTKGGVGGVATPQTFGNVRPICRIFDENLTLSSEFWRTVGIYGRIHTYLSEFWSAPAEYRFVGNYTPHSSRSSDVTEQLIAFETMTQKFIKQNKAVPELM